MYDSPPQVRFLNKRKQLLICFDFEGQYGMPFRTPYDLQASTYKILKKLESYQVHAVFFIVGRIVEDSPEVVRAIAAAGHEIGLHGYEHEDLTIYDGLKLTQLNEDIARVTLLVEEVTGLRPLGFRAPYCLGPRFYRAEVYALLRANGYQWVSNREVRYPVELYRPGRLAVRPSWGSGPRGMPRLSGSRVVLAALNIRLVAKDSFASSSYTRLRWLLGDRAPFLRDGLVEIPLYAPLDCDLLGLPTPETETPADLLACARAVIRSSAAGLGPLSMVTFHDWIVAGGNRLVLLDEALTAARDAGVEVVTVAAKPYWFSQLAIR
jgi:peptidoglycan/xylan/chitin deacetylase (PgdA/CDA1 family)